MKCEECGSLAGFGYRGRVICSVCINKKIERENSKYHQYLNDRSAKNQKRPKCEVCGARSSVLTGLSSLCVSCAEAVEMYRHKNREPIPKFERDQGFIVYRCNECGVRFRPI